MYPDSFSFVQQLRLRVLTVFLGMLAMTAGHASALDVNDKSLEDESNVSEWLGYGRTYSEQRFSPLEQINATNVAKLGVDWSIDLPGDVSLVSTPLVAGKALYFTNSRNFVRAVSATTGKLLWQYDPRVAEVAGDRMRLAFINGGRGLALWGNKVYLATADGRLIALDAGSGKEVWSVMTFDPREPRCIVGAPKAFHGKVIIGNAGSEVGLARGYVTAYDAETGKQAWRFYIVPGNPANGFENQAMAMAAKTWTGEWWKFGGGGQAWGEGFTYDPEFNTVYVGTGNGTPWNRKVRSPGGGDNLFLSSIVALNADTGEYRWHYQTTPGEQWDWDATQTMILADLKIGGRTVKALLQAPKNGFFYVIDRATGKLISAEPYAEINWAKRVDLTTGRPVEIPGARYESGKAIVTPGDWGAHSWVPMSFNPRTGLVYIPTLHEYSLFSDDKQDLAAWRNSRPNAEGWGTAVDVEPHGNPRSDGVEGTLQAWDPVHQKRVWEVPQPGIWSPGTLTTAGNLVFQGRTDGEFLAYDAMNGHTLWHYPLGLGIAAPPITYAINGRQYVALLVGWGGGWAGTRGADAAKLGWSYGTHMRRVVVFSLQGKVELAPLPPPQPAVPIRAPSFKVDEILASKGGEIYAQCALCHGDSAVGGGLAPDLRASPAVLSAETFAEVLRGGARRSRGMPSFTSLTDEQLLAVRHYVREQAELALAKGAR